MLSDFKIGYYINNISGAHASNSSFMSLSSHIGSCKPESSTTDFIELKTKVGRSAFCRSISQSPLPNVKLPVHAMIRKSTCDLILFDKWVGVKCAREKVTEAQLMKCK